MDALAHCEARVAGPGSTLHYSLLHADPGLRATLLALHALDAELASASKGSAEPAVGHARMEWWQAELGCFLAGGARHPVTRLLQAGRAALAGAERPLAELIDGYTALLTRPRFDDLGTLRSASAATAGALHGAAAWACGFRDEAAARALGTTIGLARWTRAPRPTGPAGPLFLPASVLDGNDQADPQRLREHVAAIRAELADTLTAWRRPHRYLPGVIQARIELAVLDAVARDGCRVLERRISITPLRKLWIAWRASLG